MYESHAIDGPKVIVKFKHVGDGLAVRKGQTELVWFQLTGETGPKAKWVNAKARIVGTDTVEVSSNEVPKPVNVRFAWHALARHNLVNSEALPAVCFNTEPGVHK